MLLARSAASILGKMLAGKPKIPGRGVMIGGEGVIRAGGGGDEACEGTTRLSKDF